MMTGLYVPKGHIIRGSITDRKNFYHQAKTTRERAASNVRPEEDFEGATALEELKEFEKKKRSRETRGDKLGF